MEVEEAPAVLAPHAGRKGRVPDRVLFGVVAAVAICGVVGAAFAPYFLVHHPLLLVGLNPRPIHLIPASLRIAAWPFFAVGLMRLFLPDPAFYEIGRRYGPRALEWLRSRSLVSGEALLWVERAFGRAGLLLVFVTPGPIVCTLAGASTIRFPVFVVLNVLGTLTQLTVIRLFGEAFAGPIERILGFIEEYVAPFTFATALLVTASWFLIKRRNEAREVAPRSEPPPGV